MHNQYTNLDLPSRYFGLLGRPATTVGPCAHLTYQVQLSGINGYAIQICNCWRFLSEIDLGNQSFEKTRQASPDYRQIGVLEGHDKEPYAFLYL